jgi:copper chaperone
MNTTSLQVTGMTCAHCVSAVKTELTALDGVTGVEITLVAGGASTVTITSDTPLDPAMLATAVDEAGYVMA